MFGLYGTLREEYSEEKNSQNETICFPKTFEGKVKYQLFTQLTYTEEGKLKFIIAGDGAFHFIERHNKESYRDKLIDCLSGKMIQSVQVNLSNSLSEEL